MRRRQVLAAIGGAGTGLLAGCLENECPPRADAETPPDGWPMPGFDASNAGIAPGEIDEPPSDGPPPTDASAIERWRFDPWDHAENWGGASAPVVDDERVYVVYGLPHWRPSEETGTLFAIDEATGDLDWEYSLSGIASGAPALVGDGVLVGDASGTLVRLDRATGDLDWETDLGSAVRTPAVADGWCYVQCDDGRVVAIDVETGDECWTDRQQGLLARVGIGDDEVETTGRPAVTDDAVVVTTGADGGSTAIVRVLDRTSGDERWTREIDGRRSGPPRSPVVADGTVFVPVPGSLQAFDAADGDHEWTFGTGVDETSSPAVADGTVYLGAKNVYAIDGETGEERWRHVNLAPHDRTFGESGDRVPIDAAPAVAGDALAVAFGALDRETGRHLWGDVGEEEDSDYLEGALGSPAVPIDGPAIANGALYAASAMGRVAKLVPEVDG